MRYFFLSIFVTSLFACSNQEQNKNFRYVLQSDIGEIQLIQSKARNYWLSADMLKLDNRHELIMEFLKFADELQRIIIKHSETPRPNILALHNSFDSLANQQVQVLGKKVEFQYNLKYFHKLIIETTARIDRLLLQSGNIELDYIAAVCAIKSFLNGYFWMHYGIRCGFGPGVENRVVKYNNDSNLLELFIQHDYHNIHPVKVHYNNKWHEIDHSETVVGRIIFPKDSKPDTIKIYRGKSPDIEQDYLYIDPDLSD